MNSLIELQKQGQSLWLDYIRRNLITGGELSRLVSSPAAMLAMTGKDATRLKFISAMADPALSARTEVRQMLRKPMKRLLVGQCRKSPAPAM